MTGEELRAWMASRVFTVAELSRELGITTRSIVRWRTSRAVAPAYLALALAELDRRRPYNMTEAE